MEPTQTELARLLVEQEDRIAELEMAMRNVIRAWDAADDEEMFKPAIDDARVAMKGTK